MKGHIRKRGKKYSIVFDVGRDENNRRKQKWISGFNSKKEAEKALIEKLNEVNQGRFIEPTKVTVEEYIKEFLESKKAKVKVGTWKQYRWLANHIINKIGGIQLLNLKPTHIEKMYNQLTKDGLSARTIRHLHVFLKSSLEKAVTFDMIYKNSAKVVDTSKPKRPEINVWTTEQMRSFLLMTRNDRFFIVYALALATGMRIGEILALKWDDIDFSNKVIHVRNNISRADTGYKLDDTKTFSSVRTITIDNETIAALMEQREKQRIDKEKAGNQYNDQGYVIATATGNFILPRNIQRAWYKALDKAEEIGVPKIRFHDLRHTHASHLLKNGVNIKAVSERLGHASIQITLDTYSHILPGIQEAVAHQFGESVMKGIVSRE